MYPNLYYLFKDLFGIEIPPLQIFNTFGFFVAMAFLAGAWMLKNELKRKESLGQIPYQEKEIEIGKPVNFVEVFFQGLIGFVFGWKLGGALFNVSLFQSDISGYIFSMQGNVGIGLLLGLLGAWDRYRVMKKEELPEVQKKTIRLYPSQRVGEIVMTAGIAGFAGAKIFNALETWEDFIHDPIGNLISGSGLTFLGGLICASIALYFLMKKWGVNFLIFADALAPIMLLTYGIGRMGCLVAGDGDWGIYNSAYYYDSNSQSTKEVPRGEFEKFVQANSNYFDRYHPDHNVQSKYFPKPMWLNFLPDEFFAYNFAHNVNEEGVPIPNCDGKYCRQLPWPVFPTPLYEIIMSFVLFALLWYQRLRLKVPGMVLAIYMVYAGIERFWIEKIRVNTEYDIAGLHPSQAELLSVLMVLSGIIMFWKLLQSIKK